jgi:hypothetical protein
MWVKPPTSGGSVRYLFSDHQPYWKIVGLALNSGRLKIGSWCIQRMWVQDIALAGVDLCRRSDR